ncbi:MAG: SurA N-terminal domain-containing protein [Trueperaceae bacterium]
MTVNRTATSISYAAAGTSRFLALLFALLSLGVLASANAQSDAQEPLVIETDQTTLSKSEFDREFEIAARAAVMQQGVEPTEENLAPLQEFRPAFLDQLANQLVLLEEAEERGVAAPEEEVESYVQQIREVHAGDEEFAQYLSDAGFSEEAELRERVAEVLTVQLVVENLATEVEPTDAEIDAWYDENQEQLPAEADDAQMEQIREQVATQLTQEGLDQLIQQLRADSNVQVYPENL